MPSLRALWLSVVLLFAFSLVAVTQTETAVISGRVTDPSGAVIKDAEITITNIDTNISSTVSTNDRGIYVFPGVYPGRYRLAVKSVGFKEIVETNLIVHVQDTISRNYSLALGSINETVTVVADEARVNTESAAVSTVIDRKFVEDLPLNGRSFNTLLQLTPGVVIAPNNTGATSQGQFSIAGQRTDANNFTVDGVSANFGVGAGQNVAGSGTGGAQAFSVLGSTSSLVSVDALQEFRIETSSFAPEFGRTPGGQVILSTRSGTNSFHGGVFDYFRNTAMDANDWFANQKGLPRAAEHHNDFGGFFGGPIWKNKTFFFLSYEGARLDLPQTLVVQVPSTYARNAAPVTLAPYLNAYPLPDDRASVTGVYTGPSTGTFSDRSNLDAASLRVDHTINNRLTIFARYNYAPSNFTGPQGGPSTSLSSSQTNNVKTTTFTAGLNMLFSNGMSNTLRGNYSFQSNDTSFTLSSFGGAVQPSPNLLLGSLTADHNLGLFFTFDTSNLLIGNGGNNHTRQINFTDDFATSIGSHQLKVGGDYRGIFLNLAPQQYEPILLAPSIQQFLSSGSVTMSNLAFRPAQFLVSALSLFAQDNWKVNSRLTLTYGLRWELNPAPSTRGNTTAAALQNLDTASNITLAFNRPLWATTYNNVAPRLGVAYSLMADASFVLRAGGGIFYDLGAGSSANLAFAAPNRASSFFASVPVPVADISAYLPVTSIQPPYSNASGFDPALKLPRSYQWSVALEKSFAGKQAISATYVGQAGRDLLRSQSLYQPNANFVGDLLVTENDARSNYHALQVQYRRPISTHLRALLNYTWSHSLDNASDDVALALPNNIVSGARDYASSDFDVRHSFSGALSYMLPSAGKVGPLALLTRDWSLDSVILARSGVPFNGVLLFASPDPGGSALSRPDLVQGQPLWISTAGTPGGKMLNAAAFSIPQTPRQGTEGRNDIIGFGLSQVDLSLARQFKVAERINLKFRADAFNLFNHPNFRNPFAYIEFGPSYLQSSEMLNQGLGGLNPLFQEGGPRSLQFSLKLDF